MKLRLSLAALILFLVPLTVFAQATFKKDYRDHLIFDINAGTSITHPISVINTQDTPMDIELYATDGFSTETGGFSTFPKNAKRDNVGKWLVFKQPMIHLEGKEEKLTEFTMTVPANATPGAYAGGISLEPAVVSEEPVRTSGAGAVISTRIVMPIFISVAGVQVTDYKWNDFTHKLGQSHEFILSFDNSGNTLIKITGDITLKPLAGEETVIPMGDITLLQKESSSASVPWDGKSLFGYYTVTANLKFLELDLRSKIYNEIGRETRTLSFSVIPLEGFVVFGGLLILLILGFVIKKVTHKNFMKRCTSYSAIAGDTLTKIAAKNKVDWKKMAKINKLKPPYDLTAGQKLLIPPKK